MNVTFFIGNGFDLGLGLKTRFSDFFPHYIDLAEEKSDYIKKFAKDISSNIALWSDFELQLGKYTQKFNNNNFEDFFDLIDDFMKEFSSYLENQEMNLQYEEKLHNEFFKHALLSFYSEDIFENISSITIKQTFDRFAGEQIFYNFVNFNYTKTLENCLLTLQEAPINIRKTKENVEITDNIGKIEHIHGIVNEEPIIGVDNITQIANAELARNSRFNKYIIKHAINAHNRKGKEETVRDILTKSQIICIYGMALGKTDKMWWEEIIKWLNSSSHNQLLIYWHDHSFTTRTHVPRMKIEDKIMNTLREYNTNSTLDIDRLIDRIHIAINKNIFELDKTE